MKPRRFIVRSTTAWIREEFALAARREDRFGTARLVRIDVSRIADPTLDYPAYPADATDDQPIEGWMLRVMGKGEKEREVPVPIEVVSELAKYLESRGLDSDPEDIGNQGAHLLGKASDADERVWAPA